MRNLVVLEDSSWELPQELSPVLELSPSACIVSSAVNVINGEVLLLTNTGVVLSHSISSHDEMRYHHEPWNLNLITENPSDDTWFSIKIVSETGALVCVSHSGHIVSIGFNRLTDEWSDEPEAEGCVEAGIAAASWNPDESMIVIATHIDTLLCMTSSFELVSESPMIPRVPESPCVISWRGDGMQFCFYSVDNEDEIAKVRVFNKDIEMLSEGRNVGDGSQAIVKGLLPAVAYATNGSLVAVAQQRTPKKQQIAFLERSGLRHGEFDLHIPPGIPNQNPDIQIKHNVTHLEWNLESSLLAVVLEHDAVGEINPRPYRTIQLYYRNNYHWYLKQQWSGLGLRCLGFDVEVPDRLYLSEKRHLHDDSGVGSGLCLRVMNMVWDTCVSYTEDCSCAVVDGLKLKITPLGKAIIPPPMCKYELDLPFSCQHVSFGCGEHGTGWVLAALCDEYFIRLYRHTSDVKCSKNSCFFSKPQIFEDINLRSLGGAAMDKYTIRGVQSVVYEHDKLSFLIVVCVASAATLAMSSGTSGGDNLLVLWRSLSDDISGEWTLDSYPIQDNGKAQRLIPWAADQGAVGVGIETNSAVSTFDMTKISFIYNEIEERVDVNFSTEMTFSENCSRQLAVVALGQSDPVKQVDETCERQDNLSEARYLYVGVSAAPHTSRLYVNDNLLSSSHVTSFAINPALGVLMFVTASAKPLMQFTSLDSLYHVLNGEIEANLLLYESNVNEAKTNYNATTSFAKKTLEVPQTEAQLNNNESSLVTFALPRPVERGTRLVGSPSGAASVVLQMPRGNLEGCEPRPLVLLKSRLLLLDCEYMKCLLLLRRQRVDLNLLIDHDPSKFLANINSFVKETVEKSSEFLSLLISALEVGNVCIEKYPIPSLYTNILVDQANPKPNDSFSWDDKVNIICEHLRSAMFNGIHSRSSQNPDEDISDMLLPLLCTYAKQQPPLLAEALFLIKRYALGLSVTPSLSEADSGTANSLTEKQVSDALSQPKAQKCLKYIAFLCDYDDLFRAALAECDFDMAHTIARQGGQMDPKEYLPLLASLHTYKCAENRNYLLEIQGSSLNCDQASSPNYCLMRFTVCTHLKKYDEALKWSLKCVSVVTAPTSSPPFADLLTPDDEKTLADDILRIVSAHNLYTTCIPQLRSMRSSITTSTTLSSGLKRPTLSLNDIAARKSNKGKGLKMITSLLSKVLHCYGEQCHKEGRYDEAISAFLSSSEATAPRNAIHSAIINGNWHDAISIGGRFYVEGDDEKGDEFEDEMDAFSSNKVTSLNPKRIAQGIIEDYKSALEQGHGGIETNEHVYMFSSFCQKPESNSNLTESGEAQSISIATLCLEYFNDIEGAIAILLLAKSWRPAAQMASRHCRSDLLTEDVGGALRFEAKAMIRVLPERTAKHTELVGKLNEMWKDPAARLEAVSGVDSGLLAAMRGEEDAIEETRSDFGGGMSVYSNMSMASNLSNVSGASQTLSMLSDSMMSQTSAMTQSSGAGYYSSRKPSSSSFSVVGLEHNLLSRGKGDVGDLSDPNDGEFRPHETNKQKRLRKKKEMRGRKQTRERDVFGLKQEAAMSKELYELGDVTNVATSVSNVCSVLLLIGGSENQLLACQLQACMDTYAAAIAALPTPSAPLYPLEWLRKREMEEIRWFQNSPENANDLLTHVAEGVWWRRAVKGLGLWKQMRKVTLTTMS